MSTELLRERYEPLGVVGRGGEAEVIRALDHLHGRQVALKVRHVTDQASRAHLLSEARLLLSLSPHPGLPLVREDFFVDERYVIAMDWIEGTDLEALLEVDGHPGLDPALAIKWHAIASRYVEQCEIFDDWGMFAYTNGAHKPWGDVVAEIDMGLWEERLDEAGWQAFISLKREIAQTVLDHGGSMTACHGATRAGDAELVPQEMGGCWDVMMGIKRLLDPNNIMNPGKQSLDRAYE